MNVVCLFTLYSWQQLASFPLNSQMAERLGSSTQEARWNSDGVLRQALQMATVLL